MGEVAHTEAECSCLPRTQVEDNLVQGVNPLGVDSGHCYQVPSDMIYKNVRNGICSIKMISFF